MTEPTRTKPDNAGDAVIAILLFASTMAVFWPVRQLLWVNFDDPQYVLLNPRVLTGLSLNNLRWAFSTHTFDYWQPLTWISYQLDISIWGVRPGPMHVENAICHGLSVALCYLLWSRTTGRPHLAFGVAALFAVHPTRVESVAWIAERKDVLSTLLALGTLLTYYAYARRVGSRSWSTVGFFVAACATYTAAVMAKPMVVTVPVLMILLDVWPLRRILLVDTYLGITGRAGLGANRSSVASVGLRRAMLEKCPFAVVAAVGAILTLASTGQATIPSLSQLSIPNRIETSIVGYVRYLGLLVFPTRLSIFYPYRFDQPPAVWLSSAGLLAMSTWLAWRLRSRRPYLVVGWAWFVLSLFPVIGLVQSGRQSLADRFVYLPAVDIFVALVWLADDVYHAGRRRAGSRVRMAFTLAAAAIITVCTILTRQYLPDWQDGVSIFSRAEKSVGDPDPQIEGHLGDAYVDEGRFDLALDHLVAAVELAPNDPDARVDLANLLMRGQPALALVQFQAAEKYRPDDAALQVALGLAYAATNQPEAAAEAYRHALRIQPDFPQARARLNALGRTGAR